MARVLENVTRAALMRGVVPLRDPFLGKGLRDLGAGVLGRTSGVFMLFFYNLAMYIFTV
jgi:hypothetical protein